MPASRRPTSRGGCRAAAPWWRRSTRSACPMPTATCRRSGWGGCSRPSSIPNADRLRVCTVDLGDPEPATIVCGAPNVAAGQTVAVALPGALLPGAEKPLGVAKLRGVESRGMILSATELALGADADGIMVLDEGIAPGTPLAEVLPIAETVLELEITSNRPDCLSVWGVAREVHAVTGAALTPARRVGAAGRGAGPRGGPRRARDPGPRPLPALHGPRAHRRGRRAFPDVAARPPRGGRDAVDLERRGRDQLRHAPHRPAAARLRPRPARRGPDRRAPGDGGRADRHPRRRRAHPRRLDARDLRRRAPRRDRRCLRRRVRRGLRGHHAGPARVGELRRPDHPRTPPWRSGCAASRAGASRRGCRASCRPARWPSPAGC